MRGLAAAVLAGLLASGCGGSPEPGQLPAPERSSTPSASATPAPPVMPKAAKAKTRAGAIAFARHYVQFINHAQATGDTRPLESVEAAGCASCAQSRRAIEQVYASGARVQGGDWSINGTTAIRNPASSGWLLELAISFGPQTVDRPGTSNDQRLKGGRLPVNLQIVWRTGFWEVIECTRGA
jgi:hypothetical protein